MKTVSQMTTGIIQSKKREIGRASRRGQGCFGLFPVRHGILLRTAALRGSLVIVSALGILLLPSGAIAAGAVIDQRQPTIDGTVGGLVIGGQSQQKLAQVVTQGISGLLLEVRFPVDCAAPIPGEAGADLLVEIQGVTAGKPNGVVFTSQLFLGTSLPIIDDFGFRFLALSTPVFFSAGTQFAIVLSSPGACGVSQGPAGNPYPLPRRLLPATSWLRGGRPACESTAAPLAPPRR